MKEFSSGKKGAAIVMHQMFLIMMLCGIYGIGYNLRRHIGGLGILSLFMVIGMVGSFVFIAYLTGVAGRRSEEDATIYLTWIDKIYTDIQMALFVAFIYLVLFLGRNLHDIQFELSGLMVAVGTVGYLVDVVFLLFYLSIVRRVKNNTLLTYSLIYQAGSFLRRVFISGQNPRLCTRKARERYEIQHAIEKIAAGALDTTLDVEQFHGQERGIAASVNNIRAGLSEAIQERIRNERMKADLITNVSHDIKTPLTSIINYVDLLEKEEIPNENAKEYLEVLERQSARLKKLIEDLIEASKASSGSLSVNLEKLEAGVFLVQTVGEFKEKTEKNKLDLQIKKPEEPIYIMADGRHFWRVIDNLMNNICKYAQPETRVYINLEQTGEKVQITFRNTSRYPLNISSEELMERFVRGDSSRNTEGNGLGLSIAGSLMELMHGKMYLVVDGDLFKVVLEFDRCEVS